jgi:undecaprenol kinase
MKNQPFSRRLGFALQGIVHAWRVGQSFRFQVIAAMGAVGVLVVLRPVAIWWAVFLLVIGAVLAAELFNTALEHLADRLHPEVHPVIAQAKDCAAGAVFVLSLVSLGVLVALLVQEFEHVHF